VRRRERLELLRNVASQIAVPLDQVASATAALGGERAFARPAQPMLAELGRESARLHRKLVDLIDAGRIEEGDLELRLETVDLRELASEAAELFRPLAAGYTFALVLSEEALHVDADPLRLQQALHALLSASLRRPPAAGEVSMRAALDGDRCALFIEVHFHEPVPFEQLFSALHGLDRSVLLVPGSGLGVRSSRRIVEALGGQLHVEARDERRIEVRLSFPARRRLTLAR
jgi:signal transduction histidine kinase